MNAPRAFATTVGEQLVEAVSALDFARVADCFAADAKLRALLPRSFWDPVGPQKIAERYRQWFGECTESELLSSSVEVMPEKLHVSYRLRVKEDGVWYVCEQAAFCLVEGDLIYRMDLLCSGFQEVGGEPA